MSQVTDSHALLLWVVSEHPNILLEQGRKAQRDARRANDLLHLSWWKSHQRKTKALLSIQDTRWWAAIPTKAASTFKSKSLQKRSSNHLLSTKRVLQIVTKVQWVWSQKVQERVLAQCRRNLRAQGSLVRGLTTAPSRSWAPDLSKLIPHLCVVLRVRY